ncbi:MAG: undecaprenyl/decaprenyl-phosphate alpha-N-acetylglucosaminyl 1-phosphate transferase [Firmicutes bacterium]|nr:undecaprenyl/decaprenyl-phosphate alpha-N-acetylglucosaminyl 1-phosphate transferase [Bacillota bacterium]
MISTTQVVCALLALALALVISFALTPLVKRFAQKVGAIDNPGEARRIHDHPIPRMGGLAIFLGFVAAVLCFADITVQVRGILLGAILIVTCGAVDDIISLKAWIKLLVQIAAAALAVLHGVIIEVLMNPNIFAANPHLVLGVFAIPVTIVWIVAITNSVNFIDGLDGLAVGVSTISGVSMLIIAFIVAQGNVAIILAALAGACIGFLPYNRNPAKIFMGDTGALLLGYVLSTMSILGLFKIYAIVSFAVPFLVLAVPFFDTVFAFFRRLLKGQSPMKPDRGHLHHRLIALGLSQKQAVVILYGVSAVLGMCAVMISASGALKILILVMAVLVAVAIAAFMIKNLHGLETVQHANGKSSGSAEPAEVQTPHDAEDDKP